MNVDLNAEINAQLKRCKDLADDATEDGESPLSQRAAALTTLNNLLKEITKSQLEVINMSRLQALEQTLIDLLPEFLSDDQTQEFMAEYERRLTFTPGISPVFQQASLEQRSAFLTISRATPTSASSAFPMSTTSISPISSARLTPTPISTFFSTSARSWASQRCFTG